MFSIFMPAYNAHKTLESVLDRIDEKSWKQIQSFWIINDGSVDKTGELIDIISKSNSKVKPIHFQDNQGYGNAVRKGLSLCKEDGCEIAICLHADGQYPPEVISEFSNYMLINKIDILQGSRLASGTALQGGMPLYKLIAGKVLTFFENKTFHLHMSDYHSGFLLYSRKALDTIPFQLLSKSFDFDLEVIACARAKGLRIHELPIPTRYAQEKSYLNPITYGLRVVKVMIKYKKGFYHHLVN